MKDKWERELEDYRDCVFDKLKVSLCSKKKTGKEPTLKECIECAFEDLFRALSQENAARATLSLLHLREIVTMLEGLIEK